MPDYLKRDIARILKRPPRTIEFWTSSGLVIPDIEPSQGKGKPRIFSGRNLIEFGMIEVMTRQDVSLDTIRNILAVLREGKWVPPYTDPTLDKTEREEWRRKNTVHFESFWTDEEWGVSKELVFTSMRELHGTGEPYKSEWWYVLYRDQGEGSGKVFSLNQVVLSEIFGDTETIIWVSRIKIRARNLILG